MADILASGVAASDVLASVIPVPHILAVVGVCRWEVSRRSWLCLYQYVLTKYVPVTRVLTVYILAVYVLLAYVSEFGVLTADVLDAGTETLGRQERPDAAAFGTQLYQGHWHVTAMANGAKQYHRSTRYRTPCY